MGKRLNFPAGFSQNSIKPKYPGFDPRLRRITFFVKIVELWPKCRVNPPAKQISRFRGYNLHEKHLKSCVATEGPPSILSTALLEWKLITPHGRPYRFGKRTEGGRKWKVVGIPIGEIPIKAPIAERQEKVKSGWNPHRWNSDKSTNCLRTKSGIEEKSTGVEMRTWQDRKDGGGGGGEEWRPSLQILDISSNLILHICRLL